MYQEDLKELLNNKVKETGLTKIICEFIGYYECFSCKKKDIFKTNMKCCKHCLFYTTIKSKIDIKCNYMCLECYNDNKHKINKRKYIDINITFLKNDDFLCHRCYMNCISCNKCFYDIENENHFKCYACQGVYCNHCSDQIQFYSQILCDFCHNIEVENYFIDMTSD